MIVRWGAAALGAILLLLASGLAVPAAAEETPDIAYDEDADGITIATDNATVDISKLVPSAMIRSVDHLSGNGYGFVVSELIGYNYTDTATNPFADWAYQTSLDGISWEINGPSKTGSTVTVALKATIDMNRRLPEGTTGTGETSQPGVEIIHDWAEVQFTFQVSTEDSTSTYPGFPENQFEVNGSTEMKFDISIRLNKAIYANRLAVGMSLCTMEDGDLVVAPSDEPYRFYGYQADGVSSSDPTVNETDGSTQIVHRFVYRPTEEQMFAFVEDGALMGYFAWANKIMLNWSAGNSSLADSTALYGTDGECLRLYLSSPIAKDVTVISMDQSIGVFAASFDGDGGGGGVIRTPEDGGIFGSPAMSVAAGALIGGAIIGGAVAALYVSRRSGDDPAEIVSIEDNRYYRDGRR